LPDRLEGQSKKRRVLLFVALVIGASIVAAALMLRGKSGPRFLTAPVTRRTIVQAVEAPGIVDVSTRADVSAPIAGRLVSIAVEAGASVEAGAVLAQLDDAVAEATVKGAAASHRAAASHVTVARAAWEAATDALERTETLAERGLASAADMVQARASEAKAAAELEGASADLVAARENMSTAKLTRSERTIRAPMNGVVLQAPRWVGAVVGPEAGSLFVIGSDLGTLRIDASVPEADIGSVHVGQAAEYSVPAFPGRTFRAEVVARAMEPEKASTGTTYRVTLRAPNEAHSLLPGMTATVRLQTARADNVLAVREAALRFTPVSAAEAPPRSRVFRAQADRLVPVKVVAGVSDSMFTQVTPAAGESLAVGDSIAIGQRTTEPAGRTGPGITLGNR